MRGTGNEVQVMNYASKSGWSSIKEMNSPCNLISYGSLLCWAAESNCPWKEIYLQYMLALWNGIAFWSAPNVNTPPTAAAAATGHAPPPHPTLSSSACHCSSRPGRPPKRTQSVTSTENPHIMPHSVPGLMSPGMIPPTGTAFLLLLRFFLTLSFPFLFLVSAPSFSLSCTHTNSFPTSGLPAACPRNGNQSKVTHAPSHQTPAAHSFTKNRSNAQPPQTKRGGE